MKHAAAEVAHLIVPGDEIERIEALHAIGVLDSPQDWAFDRLTELACKYFDTPIAIVTLVDSDRIWFKSCHGIDDIRQIDRGPGLCASAIMQDETYVCSNLLEDPYSVSNPLVAGDLALRFYAAAPLRTKDGHNLGTFCVLDRVPREFSQEQSSDLKLFAELAISQMEQMSGRREIAEMTRAIDELNASLSGGE